MRIAKYSFSDTNSLDADNCTKGTAFKNCSFSFRDFIIIKSCNCLQNLIDNDYVEFTSAIFVRFVRSIGIIQQETSEAVFLVVCDPSMN